MLEQERKDKDKSLRERIQALQGTLLLIQTNTDFVLSLLERAKKLVNSGSKGAFELPLRLVSLDQPFPSFYTTLSCFPPIVASTFPFLLQYPFMFPPPPHALQYPQLFRPVPLLSGHVCPDFGHLVALSGASALDSSALGLVNFNLGFHFSPFNTLFRVQQILKEIAGPQLC